MNENVVDVFHSVEIAKIYVHNFIPKIPRNQLTFYLTTIQIVLTKFLPVSKFLVIPHYVCTYAYQMKNK